MTTQYIPTQIAQEWLGLETPFTLDDAQQISFDEPQYDGWLIQVEQLGNDLLVCAYRDGSEERMPTTTILWQEVSWNEFTVKIGTWNGTFDEPATQEEFDAETGKI